MKKYREFKVETHSIKSLSKALVKHAKHIGYKHDGDNDDYPWFWCGAQGDCALCNTAEDEIILSLDEFFKLTKEDVIVEPERFACEFSYGVKGVCMEPMLTQDQIDRIKEVMNEQ